VLLDVEPPAAVPQPAGTVLRVDPIFDVTAAFRLREAIARIPASEPITLDFSQMRECHDFALAALLHAIAVLGRTAVSTLGLREHHHRLLRYLGNRIIR